MEIEFKFGRQVDRIVSASRGWQINPERGVVRSRELFKFWWALTISLLQPFQRTTGQILYACRLCQVPAYWWQMTLKRGVVWVTWPTLNLGSPPISLEQLNARIVKFCKQVECIKSLPTDDKPPLKGVWSESHEPFSISMPAIRSPERLKRKSPNCVRR